MLSKYKKFFLAIAACLLSGLSATEAAVTLTFSQVGANVEAKWSGTYQVPEIMSSGFLNFRDTQAGPTWAYASYGRVLPKASGVSTPSALIGTLASYSGDDFNFYNTEIYFKAGSSGTLYSPTGTYVFTATNLATMGASSLVNQLVFTGDNNVGESSKIYFNTAQVPEPSTAMISVLGLLAAGCSRRRI